MSAYLTLGPNLFHWPAEQKRDFYFQIADEAPVETVYLGEVICAKRTPFFEPFYDTVIERLQRAGKKVVFSLLAEVMTPRERKLVQTGAERKDIAVEANDASALYHLRDTPHYVGQYLNVYNEDSLAYLAQQGAQHFSLPSELSADTLEVLGKAAAQHKVSLEAQVYGRTGLALSARCYHARAHGRIKDNCEFVCGDDPDGMELKTLGQTPFLAINGIQTMSHTCLNLIQELAQLQAMGISAFRLSPHTYGMVKISTLFHDVLQGRLDPQDALAQLHDLHRDIPFSNGFYYKKEGHTWTGA